MENSIVYVVGNKFLGFSAHDNIYTYSQFIDLIYTNMLPMYKKLILGHGLNQEEKKVLYTLAKEKKIDEVFEVSKPTVDKTLAHKYKEENVIISEPDALAADRQYLSYLYVNADCAELNDHMTGQHLQGMLIMEAARQMMLAVSEKYILRQEHKKNFYCLLLRVNSNFYHFGFPIKTKLIYSIYELNDYNDISKTYTVKSRTDFMQNQIKIASVEIDYLFRDRIALGIKEAGKAKIAFEKFLENLHEN